MDSDQIIFSNAKEIDPKYEFTAPKFFDFFKEETAEDMKVAEAWFDQTEFIEKVDSNHLLAMNHGAAHKNITPRKSSKKPCVDYQIKLASPLKVASDAEKSMVVLESETRTSIGYKTPIGGKNGKLNFVRFPTPFPMKNLSPLTNCTDERPASMDASESIGYYDTTLNLSTETSSFSFETSFEQKNEASVSAAVNLVQNIALVPFEKVSLTSTGFDFNATPESVLRPLPVTVVGFPPNQENRPVTKVEAKPLNKILHSHTIGLPSKVIKPVTSFKEFHFRTEERIQEKKTYSNAFINNPNETYTPLAVQVDNYFHKYLHRGNIDESEKKMNANLKMKSTKAISPDFATTKRIRNKNIKSTAEMEEEEIKKQFKALPFNKKIFDNFGGLGLPPTTKKEKTQFNEFHLQIDDRSKTRVPNDSSLALQRNDNHAHNPFQFNAMKLNDRIAECNKGIFGMRMLKSKKTKSNSFHFATASRAESRNEVKSQTHSKSTQILHHIHSQSQHRDNRSPNQVRIQNQRQGDPSQNQNQSQRQFVDCQDSSNGSVKMDEMEMDESAIIKIRKMNHLDDRPFKKQRMSMKKDDNLKKDGLNNDDMMNDDMMNEDVMNEDMKNDDLKYQVAHDDDNDDDMYDEGMHDGIECIEMNDDDIENTVDVVDNIHMLEGKDMSKVTISNTKKNRKPLTIVSEANFAVKDESQSAEKPRDFKKILDMFKKKSENLKHGEFNKENN